MQTGLQILNNMFGYNTPVPDAPVTRHHRLGVYSSGFKRVDKEKERVAQQKVKPVVDSGKLKDSEKRVLMIVKCAKGITGVGMAKKTGWTANHCSMILTKLYRKKLIQRIKRAEGQFRFYEYFKRDPT